MVLVTGPKLKKCSHSWFVFWQFSCPWSIGSMESDRFGTHIASSPNKWNIVINGDFPYGSLPVVGCWYSGAMVRHFNASLEPPRSWLVASRHDSLFVLVVCSFFDSQILATAHNSNIAKSRLTVVSFYRWLMIDDCYGLFCGVQVTLVMVNCFTAENIQDVSGKFSHFSLKSPIVLA